MKNLNSIKKFGILGTVLLFVFISINSNVFAAGNSCEITKVNGGGFSTTISSVTQVGGQYVITLSVEHDGCGGPTCKELSHYSIEADNNTYSNVSWNQVWGDATMTGNIAMSLGNNDPFDGFKLDNTSNIGDGDAGEFTITYTLTYLQDQQTLAKAGNNYTQIAAFTTADFQQVLNCSSGNNPPVAVNDTYLTNVNTPVSGNVTDNDSDPDGDNITVTTTPTVNPQHGSVTLNSNGTFTYTPNNGFAGTDTFKYKICDDGSPSLCDEAWVTITINTLVGPTANDDSETTPFNTPVDIDALNNDVAGDAALNPTTVTFVGGTEPNAGTEGVFTVNATTGLVTFTPATGFTGTTTIDYTVCDFNSLCATATITVIVSNGNDGDGDGIPDGDDDYPNDPDRAFNNFYPAGGNGTLAYEDLWPSKGDYDFNDLIILYRFKTVTNASNHVVETFADFTVKAFGAGYQNGFGFQWPNAAIDQSKITVTGSNIGESYVSLGSNGLENGQSKPTFILYDNTYNIMQHPGMGTGVNTEPWATYVTPVDLSLYIDYVDNTYNLNDLDVPNFNPFIMVNLNRNTEVHLPDYPPTDLANQGLFGTWDDDTSFSNGRYYKTENNLPWAINIPVEFEYPIERQDIIWVYLKFADWAESDGQLYQDWYLDLQGYRNNSLIYDNQP